MLALLRNSRVVATLSKHMFCMVANSLMRRTHFTLHELLLPSSAEWVNDSAEWLFARVDHGLGYVLQNNSARELEDGQVVVTCSCSSRPVTIRASQIGELKLHWFRLCPGSLTGFFSLYEQHYLDIVAAKRKVAFRTFPASQEVAKQFAELSRQTRLLNSLVARHWMLGIVVTALHDELSKYHLKRDARLDAGERFKQLIAAAPAAEIQDISIAELASECGCGERHLNRLFRAHFGFSLRARQMELRLRKAQKLLRESQSKILHVAIECGFRQLGLFNAMFKKRFGMTPSEWREQGCARAESSAAEDGNLAQVTKAPLSGRVVTKS